MKKWAKLTLIAFAWVASVALAVLVVVYFASRPMIMEELVEVPEPPGFGGKFEPKDIPVAPSVAPAMMAAGSEAPTVPIPASGSLVTPVPSAPQIPPSFVKVALERKLIREAFLTLRVADVPKAVQEVRQVAGQLDGYVAQVSQNRSPDGTWSAELILRVPSERYHEALSKLQQIGQVDNLSERVQDVTEEFVDLEARLRNLKRSEQHLLELLKRSGKVSELLQVERELAERRSEIERLEGRLRYLTHQTTFSTISVTLEEFRPRPVPETAFSITKIFADAFRAVVIVLRFVLVIAIWVLVFGIVWVPLFALVRWLIRRVRGMAKEMVSSE